MAKRNERHLWRPAGEVQISATGDVVVREPKEGWSPAFYQAVLAQYLAARGAYPRTARMHPSTALAVAPADRAAPEWWPIYEIRRHYAPARIILSEEAPEFLER
jgi:hypothetical protein